MKLFFIKRILQNVLGFERYLGVLSYVFLKTYTSGFYLKAHRQVRFLKNLVKEGDVCIDIGANLGYFSVPLSHICGQKGKVYAVEPVPVFRKTLEKNLKKFALGNVEVIPFALGGEEGRKVLMGTLNVNGVARHGMTQVMDESEAIAPHRIAQTHEAEMRSPISLFGKLPKIDFIKCDVEGYETQIIPHFIELIDAFKPKIEIEVDKKANKEAIMAMLQPLGYRVYYLNKGKLLLFDLEKNQQEIELYFIHP